MPKLGATMAIFGRDDRFAVISLSLNALPSWQPGRHRMHVTRPPAGGRRCGSGRPRHGGRAPAIEERAAPQLKRHQYPQMQIQRPALLLTLDQTLHIRDIENSPPPKGVRQ